MMSDFPKLIYALNTIPIKVLKSTFSVGIDEPILKFIQKIRETRKARTVLKKTKLEDSHYLFSKLNYKAIVEKKVENSCLLTVLSCEIT